MIHPSVRPLGLPRGSVRAILALVVVIVACRQMLSGEPPSLLLAETLMIVLTHYFTARRQVELDEGLRERLMQEGAWPAEDRPLWLPRGTIRLLIIAAFGVTVVGLIGQGRLLDSSVLTLLGPFAAYLLGALFGRRRRRAGPPGWLGRLFIHLLALVVVLIGLLLLLFALSGVLPTLPDWGASLLLAAILYYFGSR